MKRLRTILETSAVNRMVRSDTLERGLDRSKESKMRAVTIYIYGTRFAKFRCRPFVMKFTHRIGLGKLLGTPKLTRPKSL